MTRHYLTPLIIRKSWHPVFFKYITAEAREETFKEWPKSDIVSGDKLSKAGLFYGGRGDEVFCYFGGCGLRDWVKGDDAFEEHRKHYQNCAFVLITASEPEKQPPEEDQQPPFCTVCLTRTARFANLPCGHLASCSRCTLQINACPVCRSGTQAVVRVFVP